MMQRGVVARLSYSSQCGVDSDRLSLCARSDQPAAAERNRLRDRRAAELADAEKRAVRSAVDTSVEKGRAERDKNIEPEENVDDPLEPKQRTCHPFQRPPDAKRHSSACESLGWLQLLLVNSCPSPPPKRAKSQHIAEAARPSRRGAMRHFGKSDLRG